MFADWSTLAKFCLQTIANMGFGGVCKQMFASVEGLKVYSAYTITRVTVLQSQPAVHVQGQEPLTASMLAAAPPQEQKQMLGKGLLFQRGDILLSLFDYR